MNDYKDKQRELAAAWKAATTTLESAEWMPARWVRDQIGVGPERAFCLPQAAARKNLLPYAREGAITLFKELNIPWHCGIEDGPSNHLLDSQVQCVNALWQMVVDPARIVRAFGKVLDVAEVLEIEPGRYLTFEYIGPTDYFNEGDGRPRTRGTRCTSVDAAFRFRTPAGAIELALVEWKYTESYPSPRNYGPAGILKRSDRYGRFLAGADSPIRPGIMAFEQMLAEPFYQLIRQQLLASELEKANAEGADTVRVVHVLSPDNFAYQQSLTTEHRSIGASVAEIWAALLLATGRHLSLNPQVFLDPEITAAEYVSRYGPAKT